MEKKNQVPTLPYTLDCKWARAKTKYDNIINIILYFLQNFYEDVIRILLFQTTLSVLLFYT